MMRLKREQDLALVYLRKSKKRSVITAWGVSMCAALMFVFFSVVFGYVDINKEKVAKEYPYEVEFIALQEDIAQQITTEGCITDFSIKTKKVIGENKQMEYHVSVNVAHPFRMAKDAQRIAEKYQVDYQMLPLAGFYLQDEDQTIILVILTAALLVAFIFAVMGVGIIRNSIQLISIEQSKDYGILRCLGATKGQLRSLIYRMGFILEMCGILSGTAIGYAVYRLISAKLQLTTTFYWYIIPFLLFVFLGDLYFVMKECSRFVDQLSPIHSIRSDISMGNEIIRNRKKSIWRIFGIEGEYAYKNLMRRPGRFYKTVMAFGFGIALVIVALSTEELIQQFLYGNSSYYGYYQVWAGSTIGIWDTESTPYMPSEKALAKLDQNSAFTDKKPLYHAIFQTMDPLEIYHHLDAEYLHYLDIGYGDAHFLKYSREYEKSLEKGESYSVGRLIGSEVYIRGYDDQDLDRLKKYLVEGTTEVSVNGLILVNGGYVRNYNEITNRDDVYYVNYTDYHVGDTITFCDFYQSHMMIEKRIWEAQKKGNTLDLLDKMDIYADVLDEMKATGRLSTYVIEGIVSEDAVMQDFTTEIQFIMPLSRYIETMGNTERDNQGYMYHVDRNRYMKNPLTLDYEIYDNMECSYLESLTLAVSFRRIILYVSLVMVFILTMSVINIINTTSSNIYLRRSEFSQLRVLGMTQKGVIYTAVLEGVITTISATILGGIIGGGLSLVIVKLFTMLFTVKYGFPIGGYALAGILTAVFMVGTIYFAIRKQDMSMVENMRDDV